MEKRIRWKIIFIFSLLLTIYTLNQNFKMPVTDSGGHPDFVAYGVLLFDFLVLLGSFGYAFKLKLLNSQIWKVTLVMYPLFILLETVFDFYAGGYIAFEVFTHSLLVLFLTCLLISPIIMYLNDFKVVEPER